MQSVVACVSSVRAHSILQPARHGSVWSSCCPSHSKRHRSQFPRSSRRRTPSLSDIIAQSRQNPSDKHAKRAVSESSGWFRQRIQQYPLTFAFGTLFLVFVLPKLLTVGLVGAERTALAILLELEELLTMVILAGAKWAAFGATAAGLLALVWFESKKKRS